MDYKLTSVKVLRDLYRKFKSCNLDTDFRAQIKEWKNLKPSGSRL
jgi:hypothetical protein